MSELEAGRGLDALVAERVMGWTRVKTFRPLYDKEFYISVVGPSVCVAGDLPPYSTDIAAAWEVVEKAKGHHGDLFLTYAGDEAHFWIAKFQQRGYRPFQDQSWEAEGDTAPLAICRAAILAVAPPDAPQETDR